MQRDGEQQLLAADRAQGDRVIASRMSELPVFNDLIFAAKGRQMELETIEEISDRSKGSDETDEVDEASPVHGGVASDKSIVSAFVSLFESFSCGGKPGQTGGQRSATRISTSGFFGDGHVYGS